MKSILIGYEDADAKTAPVIVAGLDSTVHEQSAIFANAKLGKRFPNGIVRVEFCFLEPRDIAIQVSTNNLKPKKK